MTFGCQLYISLDNIRKCTVFPDLIPQTPIIGNRTTVGGGNPTFEITVEREKKGYETLA